MCLISRKAKDSFKRKGLFNRGIALTAQHFEQLRPLDRQPFTTWLDNPLFKAGFLKASSLCASYVDQAESRDWHAESRQASRRFLHEEDLYFLGQVANQIAIAVENALEYGG